ncbi:hypothetical protein [Nonomuraea sp. NPDC050786]|uniref:hypothetical protein n=1 Tax=Nonomuraea sp. NPDC050786 TaxID=3154840 RepID=UPI00340778B9
MSELELLRTAPTRASDRVMVAELHRVAEIVGLGPGAVQVDPVSAVKLWRRLATGWSRCLDISALPDMRDGCSDDL